MPPVLAPDPRTPRQIANPSTFPLWPVDKDGRCTCGLSLELCPPKRWGKHAIFSKRPQQGGGFGIYTGAEGEQGSGVFVVDLDVRGGVDGVENFATLCAEHGDTLPDTLTVETGSGGLHFYFRHPDRYITSRSGIRPGVDVKGDGGWVVGPGSMHTTGALYRVVNDAEITDAPAWLLHLPEMQEKPKASAPSTTHVPLRFVDLDAPKGAARRERFIVECRGEGDNPLPPSVNGRGGSAALRHAVLRGFQHYRLPPEAVFDALSEHFNPRCSSIIDGEPGEWSDEELVHAIDNGVADGVLEASFGPPPPAWLDRFVKVQILRGTAPAGTQGVLSSDQIEDTLDAPQDRNLPDDDHEYDLTPGIAVVTGEMVGGTPLGKLANILTRAPQWLGVLQYDALRDRVRAVNPPIKLDCEQTFAGLTDMDVSRVRTWFEIIHSTSPDVGMLRSAIELAASTLTFHPIVDYLQALEPHPDPMSYLDKLAERWFGISDPFCTTLLLRFLVGAYRRVHDPGMKFDNMLVLYDEVGGAGKSELVDAIFGEENTVHQLPDLSKADASALIAQAWCAEMDELASALRVSFEVVNSYLSRKIDQYRPAYGRTVIRKPRSCVFIGTTNNIEFIRDPRGARRFWPMLIEPGWNVDYLSIAADRDTLWAAVKALAATGFAHYVERGSADWDALERLQGVHVEVHPWHEKIGEYLRGKTRVKAYEIFRDVVTDGETSLERCTKTVEMQIGNTLKAHGCTRARDVDDTRARCWVVPEQLAILAPANGGRRTFSVLLGGKGTKGGGGEKGSK